MNLTVPTLSEAMDEIGRVGAMIGGAKSKAWAAEIRDIAAMLAEGAERGPHGLLWEREAQRLKLAATVAEVGYKRGGKSLDFKTIRDSSGKWSREKSQDFARFIRRIGGYVAGGSDTDTPADVLDYDAQHFERATQLVTGEAEPDTEDERRALERWRGKYA